ncbi:PaaI family thioesterase [Natronomonas sp. EA1]|uniref:PaaI family thioesterase n=1 Tax=Natronomonas sp. EA1 TaxID=3421655 RepID=UPI003EC067AB
MDEVPPGTKEALQHYFDTQHEFLSWLGIEVETFEYGHAVMRIPYDTKLTNVPWEGLDEDDDHRPPVQGGVASTLIDVVGGVVLRPYLPDPVNDNVATINLNVNYLRQTTDDLVATADVIRAGGTVGVSQVMVESEVPDEGMVPVAAGMGAYRLFKSTPDDSSDGA